MFEFTNNLSWFRGRHSFKAGANIRYRPVQPGGQPVLARVVRVRRTSDGVGHGRGDAGRAAFADFLLGYMRSSESAVALARTEFRSASQAYYFADTWRMRDDMTLDLGIRYEYVPPWLDKGGTLINAYLPYRDTGMPVADLSRHPVLVRIGEGDFYEDSTHPVRAEHPDVARRSAGGSPGR